MKQQFVLSGHHTTSFDWRDRARAAGIHLALSAGVAVLAGVLVFALWYPFPYGEISGGRDLFVLLVSVDVALGPLITFAIFDRAKPWRLLRRDLIVVGLLQLAGLIYGLWIVQLARPVHMVFEVDRFRVVHQIDIPSELAQRTPAGIDFAPLAGPTVLAVRPLRQDETFDATMMALQGVHPAARPDLWIPYPAAREAVLKAAKPLAVLKRRFPDQAAAIDAALRRAGRKDTEVAWLPLIARKADAWTVLLDARTAEVVAYLPLDSF